MPRRSSGPRLWYDKKRETFTIIDGRSRHRTGCGPEDVGGAKRKLQEYLEKQHKPVASESPLIADIIAAYGDEHVRHLVSGSHIQYDLEKLTKWWGTKQVTDINASTCRAYAASRHAPVASRRELAFLNAAISHWRVNHSPLMVAPKIKLPPKPSARQDFMSRSEAARFLWAARHTPHLARFFLIGWYTGSRRSVITGLRWSMVDLDSGVMQRKPRNAPRTKKRAPPVKLGVRILAHLRRWYRLENGQAEFVIHYRGNKIDRPVRSWERVRKDARGRNNPVGRRMPDR